VAHDLLRDLPAVDRLLGHPRTQALLARYRREYVADRCRRVLEDLRRAIRDDRALDVGPLDDESIVDRLERRLDADTRPGLTRVVNATGTVLHTNLGRALLPQAAIDALHLAAASPVNLEYDLDRGDRGRREDVIERLLIELTGAEAATVVNNNAAAVLLALNTLASGREVVVSRGELIEIGGAFRIPEVMARSGAVLREVGTTNRTHPSDYANAISERTGLLLKVHTSNYKVVGFVADVPLAELAAIGRARGVPVMEDLGSGALVDLARYGLSREPIVSARVALGADVVTFSGDKVLGGPQAGLAVGSKTVIERMRTNPLHRALRCGKLTIAALEATLRIYRESASLAEHLPTLRAFTRPLAEMDAVAARAAPALAAALGPGFTVTVEASTSQVGSGALPTEELPTRVIVVAHERLGAHRIAERFRAARPPIIGRVADGRFLLDVRLIDDAGDLMPRWS
jgi:L-seryl-tRNA(Ser) seleniumtransferase